MELNDPIYSVDADINESMGDSAWDSADQPANIPGPDELPDDIRVAVGATSHLGAKGVSPRVTSMLVDLRRFPIQDLRPHRTPEEPLTAPSMSRSTPLPRAPRTCHRGVHLHRSLVDEDRLRNSLEDHSRVGLGHPPHDATRAALPR